MSPLSVAFNVLAILLFGIVGYLALSGHIADWSATGRAGIVFVAAAFTALIGNLDRIETIRASVSGIEAKTREVTKVVTEARAALKEFYTLAEMTASLLFELMASEGRLGSTPHEYDSQRRARVLDALTAIGLSPEALARVRSSDKYWVSIDYSLFIFDAIHKSTICSEKLKARRNEMLARWNNEGFRPTPDDLAKMIESEPQSDSKIVDLLEDYRYYSNTSLHRRPELWRAKYREVRP